MRLYTTALLLSCSCALFFNCSESTPTTASVDEGNTEKFDSSAYYNFTPMQKVLLDAWQIKGVKSSVDNSMSLDSILKSAQVFSFFWKNKAYELTYKNANVMDGMKKGHWKLNENDSTIVLLAKDSTIRNTFSINSLSKDELILGASIKDSTGNSLEYLELIYQSLGNKYY